MVPPHQETDVAQRATDRLCEVAGKYDTIRRMKEYCFLATEWKIVVEVARPPDRAAIMRGFAGTLVELADS